MNQLFKKNILLFAAVLYTSVSFAQNGAGFTLKGTIKGVRTGKIVISRPGTPGAAPKGIDSATIKNGTFTLKGKIGAPEMLLLWIKPGNWQTKIFVENNNITVVADTTGSNHYDNTKYGMEKGAELTRVKVVGSQSQDEYRSYEQDPQQLKFRNQFKDLSNQLRATKDPEKQKLLKSENSKVAVANRTWQLKWINDFIAKHPSSTVGAYLFADYKQFDYEMSLSALETTLNLFKGTAKTSEYYLRLEKELKSKQALLPGNVAPDFTLLKRDSTKLTLSSMRGKYVLIDFWASWCHPCRKAIPHWKEVYAKYHDKGFEILSLSGDMSWKDWTKAMDVEQMPWPQVVDHFPSKNAPSVVGALYQVTFIPFYVLLDHEGKILVYSGDEKEVEAKLEQLLK